MDRKTVAIIAPHIWHLYSHQLGEGETIYADGSSVQLKLIGEHLSKFHDVTFVTGDFGQAPSYQVSTPHGKVRLLRGSPTLYTSGFLGLVRGALQLLKNLRQVKPQVIIERTASPRLGLLALYKWLFGARLVYMVAAQADCDGGYEAGQSWLFGFLYRLALRRADQVICQHEDQRKALLRVHGVRAQVIPNMVGDEVEIRSASKSEILWIGRASTIKRPELFLDLARELPEERFRMVLTCPQGEGALFQRCIRQAWDLPNLELDLGVPWHESGQVYDQAKWVVCTSDEEGFPNVFLGAGQHSCAVASFRVDPSQMLERSGMGFCSKGDWGDFKTRLREDDWRTLANKGRTYVEQHHHISSHLGDLLSTLSV